MLHLDGDAFFVAVEIAKNPKLKGLPVVTGKERGIVTALSYEAKALGVTRGLPIFQLKKRFPQVIVLPGDYSEYVRYSGMVFDIVRRYADDVEEYSIDECFADLTGLEKPLKMTPYEIASRIQREIMEETGVSVSVGVGPTKSLAKIASKWKKPYGSVVIEPGKIDEFLEKVPIEKVWGIGSRTSILMKKRGIMTALDLAKKDRDWVLEHLDKPYETIWWELRGTLVVPVDPKPKTLYGSMQRTRSFHPATNDKIFLLSQLSKHVEDACAKARHYKLIPRGVSFFLKTREFRYTGNSVSLETPTNAPEVLLALIKKEFEKVYREGSLYRATGVSLHGLVPGEAWQTDLFGQASRAQKFEEVHRKIDELEDKHGKRLVYLASSYKARKNNDDDKEDLDRNLLFL